MTLAELLTTLETRAVLKASRAKDMKTSLRYLANALGQGSPDACPLDTACLDPAMWTDALETHFADLTAQGRTISAVTRRNTRNNLRVLFRLAETQGLLAQPLPPRLFAKPGRKAFERQQLATAPYQASYRSKVGGRRFGLRQAEWPPAIQDGFRAYQAGCGLRIRETTFGTYITNLELYLGYLVNICGHTPTWEDVFDVAQLTAYIRWHGKRVGRPVSSSGYGLACAVAAIAVVLKHPASRALADLRNALPAPPPLHNKRNHWVSLATLEAVAEDCLREGRIPFKFDTRTGHPGAFRAMHFQRGVILKLLVRIPLRQRNVREMRFDDNLYQDAHTGHWHLHFSGDDLKIGRRGAQVNEYHIDLTDYCPDLLPTLTEFLQGYRPRLLRDTSPPTVFLSLRGRQLSQLDVYAGLSLSVAARTGQRFYPHLVRSIWATEYIEKTRDFTGAAYMLGDTVATVLRAYQHILGKDQEAKARAFLGTALHAG
jgi:hypothetical protein